MACKICGKKVIDPWTNQLFKVCPDCEGKPTEKLPSQEKVDDAKKSKKKSRKWQWIIGLIIIAIIFSNSETTPKNGFSNVELCKTAVSFYNSTPLQTIRATKDGGIIDLSYNRQRDNKYFQQSCIVNGNKIDLTLGYSGNVYSEGWVKNTEITFSTTEKTITIYERDKYSGDKRSKTFYYE